MRSLSYDPRDYDPMAHKGLFLGVGPRNRGRYFVLKRSQMVPLVSPLNSPGMFEELAGSDATDEFQGVGEDMRAALQACLLRSAARDLRRGNTTEITMADIVAMFCRQKGRCALTGIPFVIPANRADGEKRGPWSPSIDRINSRQGYALNNIQLVTVMANVAKAEFSVADFHRMCAAASLNLGLVKISISADE